MHSAKSNYKKGDNSLYWIHFPCKNHFLLFPETFLINEGIIRTETQKGMNEISVDIRKIHNKENKYNKYLFYYNSVDKEKLLTLLNILNVTFIFFENH